VIDLVSAINSALQPADSTGALIDTDLSSPTSIFNCVQTSLDINDNMSGSGKLSISCADADGFAYASAISAISLDFTLDSSGAEDSVSVTSKIGWNLGFTYPKYSGKLSYTGEALPEPTIIRYIYLAVNDFNRSIDSSFIAAFETISTPSDILARITITGQHFGVLMENNLTQHIEPRKYFGPVDIQRLQLRLLDDHGRVIDMNKSNYSVCLSFKCLYS